MRVVITGGTGCIGRALTRSLVRDGHTVVVLSRRGTGRTSADGVLVVPWDGVSGKGWAGHLDGADALVNLAGENIASGPWTKARRARILESRLAAGRACLEAIERVKRRPACLIQASATGYYGQGGEAVLTEEADPGQGFLASVAGRWEASTAAVAGLGMRRAVIRTAVILARDCGALPRMLPPFRLFLGGPLGSGRQWFPWIHRDDAVGAIRCLLERPEASGPFNLAAPEAVTQRVWADTLGRVLGRPALIRVPEAVLGLLPGGMGRELFCDSARVVPRRLLELGYTFRFPQLAAALDDLLGREVSRHG